MSSSNVEEVEPCGSDRGALKRRASPGDADQAGDLHVPALLDAHFVSIVRSYEELYNCDHPRYADRQRRREVWEEIGTIVNQPAEDCRNRWARIRENYIRRVRRANTHANDPAYRAKRPAQEELLSFLNSTFETKNKEMHDDLAATVLDSDTDPLESKNDDSSDADHNIPEAKHSSDDSDSSSSDDVQGPTTQAVDAPPALGQQSQLEHDDIVDFFVELGESVKDFPEGVRIHVKREAFKIVTDAEEMLYHEKIKADLERNRSEDHE